MEERLERFSVSLPKELLEALDGLVLEKGYSSRSELVRDLIREKLVEEKWSSEEDVVGVLVLIYDHHTRGVSDKLIEIQHSHHFNVISSLHIHLTHHDCLEAIVIKGRASQIQRLTGQMEGLRGVKFAKLVKTAPLEV